jgi:hypothetical protein
MAKDKHFRGWCNRKRPLNNPPAESLLPPETAGLTERQGRRSPILSRGKPNHPSPANMLAQRLPALYASSLCNFDGFIFIGTLRV